LLAEKAAKQGTGAPAKPRRRTPAKTASEPRAAYAVAAKVRKPPTIKPAAAKPTKTPIVKRTSTPAATTAPKIKPRPKAAAKTRRISAK
jgi:hypothetical protein